MNKRLVLVSLVLALFLAALPLPWLMAVPAVRGHVLSRLGTQLSGSLAADSCSFGWFSGLRCKAVRYRSSEQPFQLKTEELRSSKGLALLLLAPGYLGDINLKEPLLSLELAPAAPATLQEETKASRLPFWWNKASFQLKAQRAQMLLKDGTVSYPLFTDAALNAALANGSLRYTLLGRAGTCTETNLRAEGFMNAPPESNSSAKLLSTSTIVLDSSPIATLPPLPWAPWLFPAMEGKAGGSCKLLRNVDGSLQAQGALSLHEPLLPPLSAKETRLKIEQASLLFDVKRQAKGHWQVQQIQLDSDLANFDLAGTRQEEKTDLHATFSLSLPLLSEGLRQKLALRSDARLQSGSVDCTMQAAGPASRLPLQLSCSVSDIAAQQADTRIIWQKPLAWSAQGVWQENGLTLHEAQTQAASFSLKAGRSDAGDVLTLSADGDIGALNRELVRIIQLPFEAQGKMVLQATRGQTRDHTGPAPWPEELNFTITDFSLKNGPLELLPAHKFSLQIKSSQTESGHISGTAKGSWWPGSFDVELQDLSGQAESRTGRYHVTGSMLSARLQPLVHHFFPSLASLRLAGSMQLDLAAQLQGSKHQLKSVQAVFNRPDIRAAARNAVYSFQASRSVLALGEAAEKLPFPRKSGLMPMQMATNADSLASRQADDSDDSIFDPTRQSLRLQPLILLSDGLQLRGGFTLAGWRQDRPQYSLHAHGALDGAILDTFLRATSRMPAGLRLQGPAQVAFSTAYPGKPLPEAELAAQLDWAGFERDGRLLFHKRALNLYARFEAAESSNLSSWDIPEFSLQSPDLWALGKGFLWDEGQGSGMLALQGQYRKGAAKQEDEEDNDETNPFQLSVPFR
ncbi:MAG: hypothetical protein Q4G66_03035 [bacterium]|nr:hypothetical protein [bacterium]